MQKKIVYICDKCKRESTSKDEILSCEANHLGLSLNEYIYWGELKENAEKAGRMVGVCKNEDTDMKFDLAIRDLVRFEKEHNIGGK